MSRQHEEHHPGRTVPKHERLKHKLPKSPSCQKEHPKECSDPISADPICPSPSNLLRARAPPRRAARPYGSGRLPTAGTWGRGDR